jgi:hypothetical protein
MNWLSCLEVILNWNWEWWRGYGRMSSGDITVIAEWIR